MKQEYLVTGKMSDGNDYKHTVIATDRYKAIEQALTEWSHEVDSQFIYPVKMKATPVSERIAELEFELKIATSFNWGLITLSLIIVGLLVATLLGVK